jgi:hypothetical protein
MNQARHGGLLACALLLFFGCSSESVNPAGSGGGGGGGSAGNAGSGGMPATCDALCTAIDKHQCKGESKLACGTVCSTAAADCPSASDQFAACVQQNQANIVCDSNGKAAFIGCAQEWLNILPCTVCVVTANDTAAQQCVKEQCCPELKVAYSRADVPQYLDCVSGCPADNCGCDTTYFESAANFAALNNCQNQCPTGVGG